MKPVIDPTSPLLTPDLCIVGAGRAGLAVANGCAALGASAVVIDRDDLAQALPRAGDIATRVLRDAAGEHARHEGSGLDWPALKARALAAAQGSAPGMSGTHLRAIGVGFIQGGATFLDRGTIEAGSRRIRARRFVLATGVVPAIPAIPGLDEVPWTFVDRWPDLAALPKSLIVLGAGRSGVAMAQIFARLGCAVTLVDGDAPLRGFDPELSRPILMRLRQEGVILLEGRAVLRAAPRRGGVALTLADAGGHEDVITAGHLLVTTGRRPAVDELGLDRAAIRCDPSGIAVAADGRTANPAVFAIGDVAGRGRSLASAEAQAGLVLRTALFRQKSRFDPRSVPYFLDTDPGIAVVGLTEPEARSRHGAIGVWRWPLAETDRARAEGKTVGHIKVLTRRGGRVVGVGVVGPEAAEAIALWTLAVSQAFPIRDIAALPLPGLTYAEMSRRVALQASLGGLNKAWIDRALRVMRWMG